MSRSKKPQTDPPERLSKIERERIARWCVGSYPQYLQGLGRLWHQCRDWHLKYGVQAVNWEAAFRAWIRKEDEIQSRCGSTNWETRRPQVGSSELPQESGPRSNEMQPVLRLIGGSDGTDL